MKSKSRNEASDERDEALGGILRNAVEAAAGQCLPGFPGLSARALSSRLEEAAWAPGDWLRNRYLPRLGAAAAVAVFIGGTAAAGFSISGRARIRSSSLEVARSIMPERSRWVPEAMSGEGAPAGAMADFVEGLWSSGNGADGSWPVF
jgi:hypothetical protein